MNRLFIGVLSLAGLSLIAGCNNQPIDYNRLVDGLREAGATVEAKGNTEQPAWPELFTGISKAIILNGENLVVWEYRDKAKAKTESSFIKFNGYDFYQPPDDSSPGTGGSVDYIDYPHWYQAGRIIVIYVGRNEAILDQLSSLLGPYYAGPGVEPPPATDYTSLVDNLLKAGTGLVVKPVGDETFPLVDARLRVFSVDARNIKVDDENVTVLEYDNEATAENEAEFVSPDGFDFRRPPDSEGEGAAAHIDWIAPAHFYRQGKIIVLYVGSNQAIIDLLESLLGPQFAGSGPPQPTE